MKYSKFTFLFSIFKYTLIGFGFLLCSCQLKKTNTLPLNEENTVVDLNIKKKKEKHINASPEPAANDVNSIVALLQGKTIAIVGNQTTVVTKQKKGRTEYIHLVDTLLARGLKINTVFAPEHGFRGTEDAGATIKNGIDSRSGLPIISLYGKNKKPSNEQMKGLDYIVFDIQDVGARFYTYISTLHYVMEAAAENNVKVLVLDRPNPNGFIIDGPKLDMAHSSFVGMHPIPIMHGMTIAEYALMINGQGWLAGGKKCKLEYLKNNNYTHESRYSLPIKPSPNLPNDKAINLYSSLCFFEGTDISVGRGTANQFQVYGAPFLKAYKEYSFTPMPNLGATNPPHNGVLCYGKDLRSHPELNQIDLSFLIDAYQQTKNKKNFFNSFFIKLAGSTKLQQQIEQGLSASVIRAGWQDDIATFKKMRAPYLLY